MTTFELELERDKAEKINEVAERGAALARELGYDAESVQTFLRHYFRHVDALDVAERSVDDLLGMVRSHYQLAENRPAARATIAIRTPSQSDDGWTCGGATVVQIVTDGSYPNTANYVENYARGVVQSWRAGLDVGAPAQAVMLEPRYWFNPELESRRALIPGAIAIVMTIIGTMLTALVVAREWERGTMEAVLSTPASVAEILIGKLLPYFVLGMLSTLGAAALAVFVFGVPMRGSLAALLLLSAVFMVPALGQGLLISSLARNQFLAAQIALFTGFLPAFMLLGVVPLIASLISAGLSK